ncbi:MAG: hypothetical protein QOH57_1024, partial [Mycobacterium sp.]|nr:hypothetical protein [Mycobacterium sp.]
MAVNGGSSTTVAIYDVAAGAQRGVTTIPGNATYVSSGSFTTPPSPMKFTADGTRVAIAFFDSGSLHVQSLDTATGAVVGSGLPLVGGSTVNYSSDGTRAMVVGSSGDTSQVAVLNVVTGESVGAPVTVAGALQTTQFNKQGTRVVITTADANTGTAVFTVLDTSTGSVVGNPMSLAGNSYATVLFNATGTRAAVYVYDGVGSTSVAIVDSAGGTTLASPLTITGTPQTAPLFTADGARAIVTVLETQPDGSQLSRVVLFDAATGQKLGSTLAMGGYIGGANNVQLAPDGKHVVVTSSAYDSATQTYVTRIAVLQTADGRQIGDTFVMGAGPFDPVRFTSDGGRAIVITSVQNSPASVRFMVIRLDGPVVSVATVSTPNIATGVVTGTVNATDANGDSLSYSVAGQGTQGTAAVSPTGQFTYTPSPTARLDAAGTLVPQTDSFTVDIDDGHGGVTTTTVTVPIGRAGIVGEPTVPGSISGQGSAVSPDGTNTVQVTFDYATGLPRVTVIDNATGQQVGTVTLGTTQSVGNPIFNADGSRVAVSTSNYDSATNTHTSSMSLINTATGAQTGVTIDAPGEIYSGLQFSPDGHTAYISTVESTADGSLKTYVTVVDAVTGAKLGTTEGITGTTIGATVFSPDGSRAYRTVSYIGPDATETRVVAVNTATGEQIGNPLLFTGAAANGGLVVGANGHLLQTVDIRNGSGQTTGTRVYTIDAATGLVIGTPVDLAGSPASELRTNATGTRAVQLISNSSGSVAAFVIDTATGNLIGSVDLPGRSSANPQFTADGSKIIQITRVTSGGPFGGSTTSYVSVIDANTGAQLGTSVSASGSYFGSTVFDEVGSRVILLTSSSGFGGGNSLATVVDTGSGAALGVAPIAGQITGTALTSDGRLIVTSSTGSGSSVTSVNLADGTGVGSSSLGSGTPIGAMVIGSDGRTGFQLAMVDAQSAKLFVVDLTGVPVVLRSIAIDGTASVPAQSIADGDAISVTTAKDGNTKVTVIDTAPFLVS